MSDLVTMQVIRYALEQVADEMGYTLVRTGRSTIITEIKDISCVITDAKGQTVAQAHHTPSLLAGFEITMRELVKSTMPDIHIADEGYIVEDPALSEADPWMIASALGAAIGKIGDTDLVLCGRQASDDDNGQVGPTLAEVLGLPCVTVLRAIQAQNGSLRVEQLIPDGFRAFQVPLPALLSISNEYGKPRYPTTRGIMLAARKQITSWSAADLGLGPEASKPRLQHVRYFIPARESRVEFITGETLEEAGEKLALRLREEKLI